MRHALLPISPRVISFKRYLDRREDELYQVALDSYRAAIQAIQDSGSQAHPQFADEFQQGLARLRQRLTDEVSAEALTETQEQLETQLAAWGAKGQGYLQQKTEEVKEILLALAQMTAKASERDANLTGRLGDFTTHLETIAGLDDLSKLRSAVLSSAGDLKVYAEKVRAESRESIEKLKAEITFYQNKLEEVEQLAATDALTGLPNRRQVEQALEKRARAKRPFSIAIFDLNGFKPVNDSLGHNAGDDLLKQFSHELKSRFRQTDVVGRWGGDEFIAVLDGGLAEAETYLDRVRNWVFGQYTLTVNGVNHKVDVSASVGLAEFRAGETAAQLIERADTAMYAEKAKVKSKR